MARSLSTLNTSVFLSGWAAGFTTLTSNKTVAHQIESVVENNRTEGVDDELGPSVWICGVTRSLAAKEKPKDRADDNYLKGSGLN